MLTDEYERWEQNKRDVLYFRNTGDDQKARACLRTLILEAYENWSDIRAARDEP